MGVDVVGFAYAHILKHDNNVVEGDARIYQCLTVAVHHRPTTPYVTMGRP